MKRHRSWLASAAALVLLAGGIASCADDTRDGAAQIEPGTTTTAVRPPREPTLVVAYQISEGATVVLDLAEGLFETYQDLASEIEPTYAGPVDGTVYLHRSIHPAEVVAFDLESGQTTPIDNGSNPAVTEDGRLLAYVAGGGAATDHGEIVVRDLVSGSERRFMTRGVPGTFVTISHLSWSSDGRRLAFSVARTVGRVSPVPRASERSGCSTPTATPTSIRFLRRDRRVPMSVGPCRRSGAASARSWSWNGPRARRTFAPVCSRSTLRPERSWQRCSRSTSRSARSTRTRPAPTCCTASRNPALTRLKVTS